MDAHGKFGENSKSWSRPSAAPRATLTHFACSPNFPRASITQCTHAKYEQILNFILIILFFDKAPLEDGRIDTN